MYYYLMEALPDGNREYAEQINRDGLNLGEGDTYIFTRGEVMYKGILNRVCDVVAHQNGFKQYLLFEIDPGGIPTWNLLRSEKIDSPTVLHDWILLTRHISPTHLGRIALKSTLIKMDRANKIEIVRKIFDEEFGTED